MPGCVKRRQMFFPRFTEKVADPMNSFPTFRAAAIAEPLYRLKNRFWLVTDKVVIDVDDQNRGPLSETGTLPVTGKSKYFFIAWR